MRPCLILLAGPDGAGKTTLFQTRVAPGFAGPLIHADPIQRDPSIAQDRWNALLGAGHSLALRTVFSHRSDLAILETARARGFLVIVMHVGLDSAELSVGRVRARADERGPTVPDEDIRARYGRGLPLIRTAILQADRGMVFDNSRLNVAPKQMLGFSKGRLTMAAPVLPQWILTSYQAVLRA